MAERFRWYASEAAAVAGEAALCGAGDRWADPWLGRSAQEQGDALYHDCSVLPAGATPPELVHWRSLGALQVLGCSAP
jgi:hypothetical protein